MRKIEKGPEPEILNQNKGDWKRELIEEIQDDGERVKYLKSRYNREEIKEPLIAETYGKCIYCESIIGHVAFEHIEHIKPKSKFIGLTFEWNNLGLACQKCNTFKGTKYEEDLPFINPYDEDPADHFLVTGHYLFHRPGNKRAELTHKELKLNRPELIEKRKEKIDSLRNLLDKYVSEENERLKEILKVEIIQEIERDKEYSHIAKTFVNIIPEMDA